MVEYCEHPFVVFSQGRSGSNYMIQQLNRHPAVRAHMELLRNDLGAAGKRAPAIGKGEDPVRYLTDTVYARGLGQEPVRGFKFFYFHREPDERERIWRWLAGLPNIRAVFLDRRNLLALHLSGLRAKQSRTWHPIGPQGHRAYLGESVRLYVDPDAALNAIAKARRLAHDARRRLQALLPAASRLDLTTEELASDDTGTVRRVLAFIGAAGGDDIALAPFSGSGVRKGPLQIENEHALGAALEYHGLAWMYEDLGFEVPYPGPARKLARRAARLVRRAAGQA